MQTVELNRRFLLILIGLCLFSLAALAIEVWRVQPDGIEIVASASQDQQGLARDNSSAGQDLSHPTTVDPEQVPIYLVGAIQQPGIYLVSQGSYLYELVEKAGGLRDDAAKDAINLALQIQSNCHIRIPTVAEVDQNAALSEVLQSDATAKTPLININTATADELDLLPGIGPATAKAIIDYRERNGPYKTKEDLMQVSGIKQSRLDAIADLIVVS